MRSKFYIVILVNITITIILLYHEKLLTNLDKYIMPDSSELCKEVPQSLSKLAFFLFSGSKSFFLTRIKLTKIEDRLKVTAKRLNFDEIEGELEYLQLRKGGRWWPTNNKYSYKIAIIVPYRDRLVNLELLMRNLHPFLTKQNVYYGVYVVEPVANLTFNKGLSMNVGFIEATKEDEWDCYIFHDVDLLPENNNNIYGCDPNRPKLMAVAISAYGYS